MEKRTLKKPIKVEKNTYNCYISEAAKDFWKNAGASAIGGAVGGAIVWGLQTIFS